MSAKRRTSGARPLKGRAKPQIQIEELEDEFEVFERRLEWFRELHTDRQGCLPPNGRRQAFDQAAKLGRVQLRDFDPGGLAPKRGVEIVSSDRIKVQVRKGDNPRPKSSFGFAAQSVEVLTESDLRGTALKMTIDKELSEGIDPATIRIFRFEESVGEWHMVARSGASVNGDYAWARLHRPGLYVPIGLPRDPWLLRTIMVLDAYTPWLRAAREMDTLEGFLDPICQLILCADMFEKVRDDPALADRLGLPPFEGGRIGTNDICDRCLGLDVQLGGLPELDILHDLGTILWPPIFPWPSFCNTWLSAGPRNFSGRIKSLVIHPTDGNIVYAGGADGGVWKTYDGGTTWYSVMQLELSMAVGALGISANSPNVLYAATGENVPGWGPSYPGIGVYKTTDGGGDWDLMAPIGSNRCSRVLVDPTDPNIVYIAGNGGLHKSTNGGASWTNVRSDFISDALMDPLSPNTIYAAAWNSGIYKSLDGGTTWTLLNNGIPTGVAADWIKLAMGLNGTDGTAFLIAKMGTDSGLMYKSNDAGTSWTSIPGTHQGVRYNEWTNMVAVDPNNQNVIFAGGVGVERSSNGGTSFTGIVGTHSDHHELVFSPTNSNICYMATDGGVYKSTDNGVTWTLNSQGLVSTQLYSIGVAQTSPFVMGGATQDQGILRSDGSPNWVDTGAGNEGGFFIVDPNNSNNIYVTPWSTNLRRSTDGGVSWTTILNGLALIDRAWTVSTGTFTDQTAAINSDAVGDVPIPGSTLNNALYVGSTYQFFRFDYVASTLGAAGLMAVEYWNGSAWAPVPFLNESPAGAKNFTAASGSFITWGAPNPNDWAQTAVNGVTRFWIRFRVTNLYTTSPVLTRGFIPPGFAVSHLAVKPGDSMLLLCTGVGQVFRSSNQGSKWDSVLNTYETTTRIAFSPSSPAVCYAATSSGRIYRSTGSGAPGTWSEPYAAANRPPMGGISAIAVGWNDPNLVLIAYGGFGIAHIFRSTDGGAHWSNASGVLPSDGLPDIPVSALVINQYNSEVLYIATDIGVFRTRDGGDSWEPFDDAMPRILITELILRKNTNTLYASTMGRGAYKRML